MENDIKYTVANNLINYKRLDLIIKYLRAQEILEQNYNPFNQDIFKDLYIRHILLRTKGYEPKRIYENINSKDFINDYCNTFDKLVLDMKNNGFNPNYPIHWSKKNSWPENGAHRIAAATLLNLSIPYKIVEGGDSWSFDWFCKMGFNTEDKQRILKGYADIKSSNCAIFIIWNHMYDYIDHIKNIISNRMQIIGEIELDFEDNYKAFTNLILDIYEYNIRKYHCEEGIREKIKILSSNRLNFKVILTEINKADSLENKKFQKINASDEAKLCKNEIRALFNHLFPQDCFCTIHSSSDEKELIYLSSILFSPNNIKHLKLRLEDKYDPQFIDKLREIPKFINSIGISNETEICIIGSSVMTPLGIKENFTDIDFITDTKYRERLGWTSRHIENKFDLGTSDKYLNQKLKISDNIVIYNDNYHFWFKGFKFGSMDILGGSASFRTSPFYGFRPLSLRRNIQYQDSHTLVS